MFALAGSSIPKASSTGFALIFNLCNAQNGSAQTRTHNIVVTEGALNNIKLLSQADRTAEQAHADTAMANSACTYDNSTTNANYISCSPIYAYFRDNKGNLITDATKTCTWNYTNNSATAPSGGVVASAPAAQPNSRTFNLKHTSFIDGTVNCSSSGITSANATVRGGISQVELRLASSSNIDIADTTAVRTVLAGNDNVGIHRVKVFTQQGGVKSDYTDFTFNSQIINITTSAAKSVMTGAKDVFPSANTDRYCNFASGFCGSADGASGAFTNAPFKLSLTQVAADVWIDARMRGVASNQVHLAVAANNATSIDVEPIATQTAGTPFNPVIRGFDNMGNPSLRGCGASSFSMTGGNTSAAGTAPNFTWTNSGFNADTATTVPGAEVTLSAAGTQSVTFTATCATTFSSAASVTVNAAATAQRYMIGTTNATSVAQFLLTRTQRRKSPARP